MGAHESKVTVEFKDGFEGPSVRLPDPRKSIRIKRPRRVGGRKSKHAVLQSRLTFLNLYTIPFAAAQPYKHMHYCFRLPQVTVDWEKGLCCTIKALYEFMRP